MNFLLKKDYLSISLFILIFFGFYFYFKETYQALVPSVLGGILGMTIGFVIAAIVHKTAFYIRLFSFCITLIGFITVAYLSKKPSEKQQNLSSTLSGTWTSDNADNVVIKMRFLPNITLLSISPKFEEVTYTYSQKDDSLILKKDQVVRFKWHFTQINRNAFELSDGQEKLKLIRQD